MLYQRGIIHIFQTINFHEQLSIDNFKRFNNYIKFHENTGVDIIQQRFHFQPFFSENSYVAVITESQPEVYGFIEKSHAPFMGLQFPIIFGFKDKVSAINKYRLLTSST